MNSKQEKTLAEIFKNPIQANIPWNDIESLLVALEQKYLKVMDLEFA